MGRLVGALLTLLVLIAACSGNGDTNAIGTARLSIRTSAGSVDLSVEVADEPAERERGLMGRTGLNPHDGMAFVWTEPVRTAFWMKDTLIPLSIAFWDERGSIVSILDMEPCEADPCPTYDPGVEFMGALEVEQGLFDSRGVEVGDHVELGR